MPHIEDGRGCRHLLLSQLRDRGFVELGRTGGAVHADGCDPLVVGRLVAAVGRDRIDRASLRVPDRQGGAKEGQHRPQCRSQLELPIEECRPLTNTP